MKDLLLICTPSIMSGTIYRIVESQETIATINLVDNLDEQEVLENLLEGSKPVIPKHLLDYGYLLFTPFRYPPLQYGSRFGSVNEPSLFYGSKSESTCMAECAFYRLVFFHSMEKEPPNMITTQHALFTVPFGSDKGIDFSLDRFSGYLDQICDQSNYSYSQNLGSELRDKGFDCILFPSARDPNSGLNIALFTPGPFKKNKPTSLVDWSSQVNSDYVKFKSIRHGGAYAFQLEQFTDKDGNLPSLA